MVQVVDYEMIYYKVTTILAKSVRETIVKIREVK
jgi:hypothetical protein